MFGHVVWYHSRGHSLSFVESNGVNRSMCTSAGALTCWAGPPPPSLRTSQPHQWSTIRNNQFGHQRHPEFLLASADNVARTLISITHPSWSPLPTVQGLWSGSELNCTPSWLPPPPLVPFCGQVLQMALEWFSLFKGITPRLDQGSPLEGAPCLQVTGAHSFLQWAPTSTQFGVESDTTWCGVRTLGNSIRNAGKCPSPTPTRPCRQLHILCAGLLATEARQRQGSEAGCWARRLGPRQCQGWLRPRQRQGSEAR